MYRIKAISDLHIGAKEDRDDFRIDDKCFVEYIKRALKSCDALILNGDIFELWETDNYPSDDEIKRRIKKIKNKRKEIFNCLVDKPDEKIVYITGNHDKEISTTGRKTSEVVIKNFDGINLLFEHGHRHDPDGRMGSKRAKVATWIVGQGEEKLWSGIEAPINFIKKHFIKGEIGRFANPDTYKECARADYSVFSDPDVFSSPEFIESFKEDEEFKHKCGLPVEFDLICYGHTHNPSIDRFYNFMYANTGKAHRDKTIDEVDITVYEGKKLEVNLNKICF